MQHISEIIAEISQQVTKPIETGIKCFDDTIGGFYPGEVTAICGEDCCCKTAFVIHQVCHIAIDQKTPTLVLLDYISESNFISSMIAYYCNIETGNMHGLLESEQYKETVEKFLSILKESPLYIMRGSWYENRESVDSIGEFIDEKNIKIVFLDEVYYDLGREVTTEFGCIGSLAINKNIPIVVTCNIWNDKDCDGIDGARPWLTDISRRTNLHGLDVIIGFANYEEHRIFMDEKGFDLHNMIGVEILKYRGKIEKNTHYISKDYLYYRNYHEIEKRCQGTGE